MALDVAFDIATGDAPLILAIW